MDILIIDDEASVREFLCDVLRGAGYRVYDAPSGKAGLRFLRQQPVDLVITDILMPEMDGLELTRFLQRHFPNTRIIAMSGDHGDMDYCTVARFFGAHDALLKPLAVPRLLETVARLLDRPL